MPAATAIDRRRALIQLLVLLGLCIVMFWPAFTAMFENAFRNPEATHAVGAIVMIALLIWCRRGALAEALQHGSLWGIVLIVLGLGLYLVVSWPFNYAVPRRMAVAPAVGGAILAVGGWRLFWRSMPMMLLLVLAIPVGSRYYASLAIRPETFTLSAVATALDLLPGVTIDQDGLDLTYFKGGVSGAIALGASYRGASLLFAYLVITIFVTFTSIRPLWQVIGMVIAWGPIVVFANFVRLFIWGVTTILLTAAPTSPVPRLVGTVVSLVTAYLVTALVLVVASRLVTEAPIPEANA